MEEPIEIIRRYRFTVTGKEKDGSPFVNRWNPHGATAGEAMVNAALLATGYEESGCTITAINIQQEGE
jgi:hypothetical protein